MIIAVALIATALAAQPTEGPKPQRASESESAHSAANSNASNTPDAAKNGNPLTSPATSRTSQVAANAEDSKRAAERDNEKVQRWIEIFTGMLVLVGLAQAGVMLLQWRIYTRQAREMRRQRHEMRRQRHVMYRQWKAIREQVGEMTAQRGLMGHQLTTMENQVAEMKGQTEALKQSVAVAKQSAEAALWAIKLQEVQLEQWIDTKDWRVGPTHIQDTDTEAFLPIQFVIANTTRFKMVLDRVEIWIDREQAATIYFRQQLLTPDGGSTVVEIQRKLSGIKLESYRKGLFRFEIGGIVYYVDAFRKEQEQRFGFHCACSMNQVAEFKPIAFDPPDAIETERQKRRAASAAQNEAN